MIHGLLVKRITGAGLPGAADGTCNRHADSGGKGAALAGAEGFPCGLETGVIGGAERFGLVQRDRPVGADAGNREARMGAAKYRTTTRSGTKIAHYCHPLCLDVRKDRSRRRAGFPRAAYLFRYHGPNAYWSATPISSSKALRPVDLVHASTA